MKTELKIYTVEQICDGFEYNELEGKGAWDGWSVDYSARISA